MRKSYAIIGGGQAAVSMAEKLRMLDAHSNITLYSNEAILPYQRPPLSKRYAMGEMNLAQLLLKPENWYTTNSVQYKIGCTVTAVNPFEQTLTLDTGQVETWDRLAFVTGSRARKLPDSICGNLEGIYQLRTVEDADRFSARLKPDSKVTIIGGGYIGLEAAAVCAKAGLKVTLVEAAERILQRVACKETSDYFRQIHQENNVEILENTCLDHFSADCNGAVNATFFSDGRQIETDFALIGIGIIPNTELAWECGIKTDDGIVVDAHCQTSHEYIYGAGDCVIFDYKGQKTRLESVQNAIDQAECAAANMAGKPFAYAPYPWFWSDQYDLKLQIAGLNRGYDKIITRPGHRGGSVSHFYFKGNDFLAVDSINDPRTYMVCKKLLKSNRSITIEQAEDVNLNLMLLL